MCSHSHCCFYMLVAHLLFHQCLCICEAHRRLLSCAPASQVHLEVEIPAGKAKRMMFIAQIVLTVWAPPTWWQLLFVILSVGLCLYAGAFFSHTPMLKLTPDGFVPILDTLCDCTGKSVCAQEESGTGCTSRQIHKRVSLAHTTAVRFAVRKSFQATAQVSDVSPAPQQSSTRLGAWQDSQRHQSAD